MIHSQVTQSTPATNEQIGAALQVLFNSMPLPRGVEPDKAVIGYMTALQGFPIEAIANGIRRFMQGGCEGYSTTFCPRPPELATIIKDSTPSRSEMPKGKLYGYSAPKSDIIERRCAKDFARRLVESGVHPRGSIWCPGSINDRPDIGDLYGPDPDWKGAFPLDRVVSA